MAHYFGTDGGAFYNFYSGIFGVLVITGGLLTNAWVNARRHNCHQPGCWRVGRLPVAHPHPPAKKTIQERYHLYAGDKPGRG